MDDTTMEIAEEVIEHMQGITLATLPERQLVAKVMSARYDKLLKQKQPLSQTEQLQKLLIEQYFRNEKFTSPRLQRALTPAPTHTAPTHTAEHPLLTLEQLLDAGVSIGNVGSALRYAIEGELDRMHQTAYGRTLSKKERDCFETLRKLHPIIDAWCDTSA